MTKFVKLPLDHEKHVWVNPRRVLTVTHHAEWETGSLVQMNIPALSFEVILNPANVIDLLNVNY